MRLAWLASLLIVAGAACAELAPVQVLEHTDDYAVLGNDQFWTAKKNSRYCSLIWLKNVQKIDPIRLKRKGLQAWIVQK